LTRTFVHQKLPTPGEFNYRTTMSAAPASGPVTTAKATTSDASSAPTKEQKPAAALEEDDEFEDFPVEDWTQDDTEVAGDNTHLWEESWDDDDTSEDFAAQLKEELKKVEASKKR